MHYSHFSQVAILSLLLNLSGSFISRYFELPLFLDAVGTILAAVLIGPWIGGLLGLITNLLGGIFYTTNEIPFALVNFGIGVITGYLMYFLKDYRRPMAPLLVGSVIAIAAPMMAAPVATYLFGGITARGIDRYVVTLLESGQSIMSSAFWGRIPYSFVDKLLSAYVVYFIVKLWREVAEQRFSTNRKGH